MDTKIKTPMKSGLEISPYKFNNRCETEVTPYNISKNYNKISILDQSKGYECSKQECCRNFEEEFNRHLVTKRALNKAI